MVLSFFLAARSQAQDYKFRFEQATQKITGLEGDVSSCCYFEVFKISKGR